MMSNRSIKVSNREESRALVIEALDNAEGAARDIVALNAGLAIYAGNKAGSIPEALALAFEMIATGAARAKLEEFCAYTRKFQNDTGPPEALRASPQGACLRTGKAGSASVGPTRRAHALSPQGHACGPAKPAPRHPSCTAWVSVIAGIAPASWINEMNDILAKILAVKAEEVAAARQMRSEAEVLREAQARQDVRGFAQSIEDKISQGKPGVIAEIKGLAVQGRAARNIQPGRDRRLVCRARRGLPVGADRRAVLPGLARPPCARPARPARCRCCAKTS